MKTAIIYDRINKYGGAERILECLHDMYPDAPVFTAVYDAAGAAWAKGYDIRASWLQRIPFIRTRHELLPVLTPLAFESFGFDGYDLVISVTSAEAKTVITKPGTLHICYCLTPTRYLWSGYGEYVREPGLGLWGAPARYMLRKTAQMLRKWDRIAAARPDYYIAISEHVARRIRMYYGRSPVTTIFPPVRTELFTTADANDAAYPGGSDIDGGRPVLPTGYYLTVGRLVGYKRMDLLIRAFNEMKRPLVIIGSGRDETRLRQMAGKTVSFITHHLTDEELRDYYRQCLAFVFAGNEDFGIVAAEAQACGKPVITYAGSGMAETVINGKTGVLFSHQSKEDIVRAVGTCEGMKVRSADIRKHALQFRADRFKFLFGKCVADCLADRKSL